MTSGRRECEVIVRRDAASKFVTAEAINALGEKVMFRACSRPTKEVEAIYRALGHATGTVHQSENM